MPPESLKVLGGLFCQTSTLFQKLRAKQELNPLIRLCHFLAKWGSKGPVRGLLGVSRGPKYRLWVSHNLGHPYVPFHRLPGVSLPYPSSGAPMATEVWRTSKSFKALKGGSRGTATLGFPDLNYELAGDIPPALVYLVQNAQILPKVTKWCQVDLEDHSGTLDVTYLSVLSTMGAKLLI